MTTLHPREKRALILLAVISAVTIGWYVFSGDDQPVPIVAAVTDIPTAEKRLAKYRQVAATVPGKEQLLAQTKGELAEREKGLIQAETAAQAQAQLLQILRKIARAQTPPVDLKNTEVGQVKVFGRSSSAQSSPAQTSPGQSSPGQNSPSQSYGEVAVSANFECGIEQLLQILSDLTAQKEAIGTTELRIGAANPKQKTMPVRLTVSGLVRKELVAEKKGTGAL